MFWLFRGGCGWFDVLVLLVAVVIFVSVALSAGCLLVGWDCLGVAVNSCFSSLWLLMLVVLWFSCLFVILVGWCLFILLCCFGRCWVLVVSI